MLTIREMTPADEAAVLNMAETFYHSPAVEHPVDRAVLLRAFRAAVDRGEPLIEGYLLEEDGRAVGYGYATLGYAAEVGGRMLILDELYLEPECRGKGYGGKAMEWAMARHPECPRFRLEVTRGNPAVHLYQRKGFRYLEYGQMVLDR